MRHWLIGLASLGLFLGLWECVGYLGPHWQMLLPAPSKIGLRLYSGADRFWLHTLATFREIMGGLALASLAAFPLAWLLVRSAPLRLFLQPLLVVMQSVPIFALAPIMILWFDWSYTAIVFPTALMIFFPLTMSVYKGLEETPKHLLDYFTIHQATEWQKLVKLRIPWAAAHIFSGLRIAAALAGMGAVTGEWAGAQQGLGVLMMESRRGADLETTFAALFCLKIMSISLYGFMIIAESLTRRKSQVTPPTEEVEWVFSSAVTPAVLVLGLALFMTGCSNTPHEQRPLRLMLDWLPNPHHVPIYVGLKKGFFADEGVAMEVLKIQDPADVYPFLSSGQADVAISYMTFLIQAQAHGASAQAIAYLIKQPLNSFIFLKSQNIRSPADLAGKSLAETPDDLMIERQPSSLVCISSERQTTSGLTSTMGAAGSSLPAQSITKIRFITPSWVAASPMPGASYMVASMSSASARIPSSTASTGVAALRRRVWKGQDGTDRHGREIGDASDLGKTRARGPKARGLKPTLRRTTPCEQSSGPAGDAPIRDLSCSISTNRSTAAAPTRPNGT